MLISAIVMDGLVYTAYLFIVAVGLSRIFGVMKILNVAHGGWTPRSNSAGRGRI